MTHNHNKIFFTRFHQNTYKNYFLIIIILIDQITSYQPTAFFGVSYNSLKSQLKLLVGNQFIDSVLGACLDSISFVRLFGELMETTYDNFHKLFQLIFISSPIQLIYTTYSIYKNNLTLFYLRYKNSLCKLIHQGLFYKLQISCLSKKAPNLSIYRILRNFSFCQPLKLIFYR